MPRKPKTPSPVPADESTPPKPSPKREQVALPGAKTPTVLDIQGLRGNLQDALLEVHRASKRRKASKEKVDGAEQDLVNATRHAIVLEGGKEQASQSLVLALEELSDRDYKLREARKAAKAADKALDIALAARKERSE